MTICATTWSATCAECVQRELYYAIVDEVDNILIDEARTPLIISGPAEESSDVLSPLCRHGAPAAASSQTSVEPKSRMAITCLNERTRIVTLTERGHRKDRAGRLGSRTSTTPKHADMLPYLDNALRA